MGFMEYGSAYGAPDRRPPIDFEGIRDRLRVSDVAATVGVKLIRAGHEWKACCPFHADRTPSFTIFADDRRFQCFGCGEQGDVIDFYMRAYGLKLRDAIEELDGGVLREIEQRPRAPAKPKADMRPVAQRIVRESSAIEGTPAEQYLRSRGIRMRLPHTLRFARLAPPKIEGNGVLEANGPGLLPTLIAIVTDAGGELVGLQRTYLTDEGRKAATTDRKGKVKYSLGNVIGGSIQLAPAAASVIVTEGLEDGLTLAQETGRPVWVAPGTAFLPSIVFPDVVSSIAIGADGDAPGEAAAQKAGEAYAAGGRVVSIMRPTPPHKDFNAELMAAMS